MNELIITLLTSIFLANTGINLAIYLRIEHRLTVIETKLVYLNQEENPCPPNSEETTL